MRTVEPDISGRQSFRGPAGRGPGRGGRPALRSLADGVPARGIPLVLPGDPERAVVANATTATDGAGLRWVFAEVELTAAAGRSLPRTLEDVRGDASSLRVLAEWQATLMGAAAHDLQTRHAPPGTPVHVGSTPRGVDVELFVDDEEEAVSVEARAVVLAPLDRPTGEGHDGTDADTEAGLELGLVALFARLHGGRAWVQDAPGGGASPRVLVSNALPDTHDDVD